MKKEGFEDLHLLDSRLAAVEQAASSKLLQYVHRTQMRELNHLKPVIRYEIKDFLQMDYATKASLDLVENARSGKSKAVFSALDETKTAMGCGSYVSWIHRPLIDKERIIQRQEVVQVFLDHFF